MGNGPSARQLSDEEEEGVLGYDVTARAIADKIKALETAGKAGVVVLAGAGISVSAGIPGKRGRMITLVRMTQLSELTQRGDDDKAVK